MQYFYTLERFFFYFYFFFSFIVIHYYEDILIPFSFTSINTQVYTSTVRSDFRLQFRLYLDLLR